MTTPAKLKLKIYQGATFSKRLQWSTASPEDPTVPGTPIDLTGCTARMQIREEKTASAVLLELTTENGRLTITPEEGRVDLLLTDEETTEVTWETGVWDLEIVHPGGEVTRLVEGTVSVSLEVTRIQPTEEPGP